MIKNMGSADRLVRSLVAVIVLGLILADVVTGTLAWVMGIASVMFVATSLMGSCPLYGPLG
ncbi:MAG: YgaP family membrane protein, partial [Candidatus Kapaibacteriota bacterium]